MRRGGRGDGWRCSSGIMERLSLGMAYLLHKRRLPLGSSATSNLAPQPEGGGLNVNVGRRSCNEVRYLLFGRGDARQPVRTYCANISLGPLLRDRTSTHAPLAHHRTCKFSPPEHVVVRCFAHSTAGWETLQSRLGKYNLFLGRSKSLTASSPTRPPTVGAKRPHASSVPGRVEVKVKRSPHMEGGVLLQGPHSSAPVHAERIARLSGGMTVATAKGRRSTVSHPRFLRLRRGLRAAARASTLTSDLQPDERWHSITATRCAGTDRGQAWG